MKHLSFEPLKEWFGFTRRERRASFILLILVLSVAALRFIVPAQKISIEEIPVEIRDTINEPKLSVLHQNAGSKYAGRSIVQQKPMLDINKCDSASLEALPGIGPVLSARIIKYRNLLGGFFSVDQLKEVYGLPEETYNLISGRFFTDTSSVRRIDINTADYRQLMRFPYFERYEVTAILKYRELKGKISGMNEMVDNNLIVPEKVSKIGPYLEFREK
jgi:competence protein ComEA